MSKFSKICLWITVIFFCLLIAIGIYIFVTIQKIGNLDALNLDNLNIFNTQIKIYDAYNEEITSTSLDGQQTIELAELPTFVPEAFISIEDKTFFDHKGLNFGRIVKAGIKNIFSGYAREGASTITQQLIKNIYLTSEKTMSRKIQEAYLALKLETMYDKNKILETYLNVIYFGNGAYGIENASNIFFDKSATELTLAESATLAGIIKSPKTFSPISNADNCIERRNLVLKNMLDDGKISTNEYEIAINEPLEVNTKFQGANFLKEIYAEATENLNLSERDISNSGYKIYTSINPELQDSIVKLRDTEKENSALVIDNESGNIVGMFGDISLKRQPASTLKPFVCYAPAFESGKLSPATPINDEPTDFAGYIPKNAGNKYLGWTDIRTALSHSLNVPAVKALSYVGVDTAINFANNFGLNLSEDDKNFALALGATRDGISIKSIAQAYSILANLGEKQNVGIINKITDTNGNILYEKSLDKKRICSAETSYLINDILKDTITEGTAKKLQPLSLPNLCAKTGTAGAQDGSNTDAWCVSYTPQYTVLNWYGNSSGDKTLNLKATENGGNLATKQNAKIWEKLRSKVDTNLDFTRPENIVEIALDSVSLENQLMECASESTPEKYQIKALFNQKFLPKNKSTRFEIITTPTLNMAEKNGNLILSWDGENLFNYKIIAKANGQEIVIDMLEGINDKMSYELPIPTQNTDFYLTVQFKHSNKFAESTNIVKYYDANLENKKSSNFFKNLFGKIKKSG